MGFNITRHMDERLIRLEMTTVLPEEPENGSHRRWIQKAKEAILGELVDVLDPSGKIGNRKKLLTDFINRERKATTGIGSGFAIPHIRSMQAKECLIGYARSSAGYDFGAMDGRPVHHFFIMAAPPYDDSLYLKVFKTISEMIMFERLSEKLFEAREPYDVIKALREME